VTRIIDYHVAGHAQDVGIGGVLREEKTVEHPRHRAGGRKLCMWLGRKGLSDQCSHSFLLS
jgi:hypothetical protein